MPKVILFEIAADDPNRASRFYQNVFGWQIHQWEGIEYWSIATGDANEPGIDGSMTKRADPSAGTFNAINGINVPSVDQFAAKVTQNGGRIVAPKTALPGIGWVAYCLDTENNLFSLFQPDPSAGTAAPVVPRSIRG